MIAIDHLQFGYSRKKFLFSDLNLQLSDNSITGLLGKNGAGKTSLLKLIAGLSFPNQGHAEVNGFIPQKREPSFLSDLIFVPEEFVLPSISIENYIRAYAPFYPGFNKDRMNENLKNFDIDRDSNVQKMSYGQKKKFLISFALSTGCRLLILDEPTNGLDIPSKATFRKVVASSLNENQLVVISTHQVKDVENLLDRIVILEQGEVVFNQSMDQIAEKFSFQTVSHLDHINQLYSEPCPSGYKIIASEKGSETAVDIELLFNAVTLNKLTSVNHEN